MNMFKGIAALFPVHGESFRARILLNGHLTAIETCCVGTREEVWAWLSYNCPYVTVVSNEEFNEELNFERLSDEELDLLLDQCEKILDGINVDFDPHAAYPTTNKMKQEN